MKRPIFFLSMLIVCIVAGNAAGCQVSSNPPGVFDTTHSTTVTLFSNGYEYGNEQYDGDRAFGEQGLIDWDDIKVFTRIFFYPQQPGKISVAVKLKSRESCKIKISLDSSGNSYPLMVNKTDDFVTLPAGHFMISNARYHYIEIRGVSKTGKYFPDIESVNISGVAAQNLKYNTSAYRGAPSTHLWYQYPKDSAIAWFYNEVSVPPGVDATNAYYMTNGFADGYMGIQLNSTVERRFIFSIWSNYRTDNPKEIPSAYAVRLIKRGIGVEAGEFGNEGSGGHSHLKFMWKQGETYKLLVGAKSAGDHTLFTGWYFAPEDKSWKLIAQWDKSKTGGKLLSGLYSFVENFGPNGNEYFKALYGNQWMCTASGTWIELTRCSLTTTAGPVKHPRFDYGAGVENNQFYMFTGGFEHMNNLAPHSFIQRHPNGVSPGIDFSALPDK